MKAVSLESRIASVRFRRHKRLFILICVGAVSRCLFPQSPVINEFMSRNASLIPDLEGDFHDWIEIYNPGPETVRLEGCTLSDDPDRPGRWVFPEFELEGKSFVCVYASDEDSRENTAYETVVERGDLWRYQPGSAGVSRTWYLAAFKDAAWPEGPSGFGFGDGADSTAVTPAPSLFGRIKFTLSGADRITCAFLHIDYEDGFVAYINGREVARKNMGNPGDRPAWDRRATASCEARMRLGKQPEGFEIGNISRLFREGENVLAVQVHTAASGGDDLTMIPFLTVGRSASSGSFQVAEGLQLFVPPFDANFKIKAGETLVFFDPAGAVLDSVRIPELPVSVSTGRFPDGSGAWRWMPFPTPGTGNRPDSVAGMAEAPVFSLAGGSYSGLQFVTVSPASEGDTVRVTADGSDPTGASPASGDPIPIRSTCVLRARSFRAGYLPSPIATQTYLIREDRELAVVSLATDPFNLWDEDTGIYVMGPNPGTENPYFGANFWKDWERPVHVEFFETDGSRAFSLDAGIKIYGAWSRAFDQKSVAIYLRNEYDSGETGHRIFPSRSIRQFETFLLRNSGNDWQYTMFRDGLMQTLVENTAIDVLAYRPAAVFLNGEYWGLMNLREKPDRHYLASHHGVDPDNLDLLSYEGGSEAVALEGSADAYRAFIAALGKMDMPKKDSYAYVHDRIDLDNFMDYMIAQIYFDNTDWPGNNIKYWKARTPGSKWRWILFDTDFGFALYDGNAASHNTLAFALDPSGPSWPNPPYSTFLLRKLLENPVFRGRFIVRAADHMNATFEKGRVLAVIDSLALAIAYEIPMHHDRWPRSAGNWEAAVDVLRNFAARRVPLMRLHFLSQFKLAGTVQISLNVSDMAAGSIQINSLKIRSFPWTGTYFRNLPVEVTAVPRPGFRFAGWSEAGLPDSVTAAWVPDRSLYLTARFEPSDGDRPEVVINEINYHSADVFDTGDWVELVNSSDASVDISGWSLRKGLGNARFIFPGGSVLAARRYALLSRDTVAFRLLNPDVPGRVNGISFNLENSGDTLVLADRSGAVIDSLAFSDDGPWPAEADGVGYTLSLGSPGSDNTDPASWSASRFAGGTPGRPNSSVVPVADRRSRTPEEFRLYDNFPNPFNASTTVRWDVAVRSHVTVAVHDIRGRCVRILADGDSEPGEYSFRWDAEVTSGVYVLRMSAIRDRKQFVQSGKMVCIR